MPLWTKFRCAQYARRKYFAPTFFLKKLDKRPFYVYICIVILEFIGFSDFNRAGPSSILSFSRLLFSKR